jgi:hypothetical protein
MAEVARRQRTRPAVPSFHASPSILFGLVRQAGELEDPGELLFFPFKWSVRRDRRRQRRGRRRRRRREWKRPRGGTADDWLRVRCSMKGERCCWRMGLISWDGR